MATNEYDPTNLNKARLSEVIADRMGLARSVSAEVVETVFDVIAQHVAQGFTVQITNFGSFSRIDKPARTARNPQTGGTVKVPERKGVKFAVSPRLLDFANSADPNMTTIRKLPKSPLPK